VAWRAKEHGSVARPSAASAGPNATNAKIPHHSAKSVLPTLALRFGRFEASV